VARRPARSGRLGGGRLLVGVGPGGQHRLGPLDEHVRWVGVEGDVLEAELAQPALAVLVAGRGDPDHRQTGGGQPRQRVPVQPAGAGGDDRRLGLAGGGHGEQVAQVVAAVQHLRGHLRRLRGSHMAALQGCFLLTARFAWSVVVGGWWRS
jgi:hypothetical protein